MDALNLLIADHNRIRGLFARYQDAKESGDAEAMGDLAAKVFAELEVHTTLEEEIFYPWSHDLTDDIAATVDEGFQEHHVVKVLIEEISDLDVGAGEWIAKMQVLIENVEHHAGEEEEKLFPPTRSATSADDRTRIGDQMDAKKGELGAPILADTIELTDQRLHELAQEQAIPGRSKMDHDELAATVSPG